MSDIHDKLTESSLEETTLAWFDNLGYSTAFGPDLAFDCAHPERKAEAQYSDLILENRLRTTLRDINPNIPYSALDDALRKITRTESPSLIENNRRFHRMLTDGVDVEVVSEGGYGRVPHVEPACAMHADREAGL